MRPNVGVVFGGNSVEHEISILSAVEVMNYMDSDKYNVIPLYIDKDNNWYTGLHLKDILHYRDMDLVKRYAKKVTLVKDGNRVIVQSLGLFKKNLNVLNFVVPVGHGTYMEDGSLQGYLDILGIPYAMSNVSASAIGMDKVLTKQLLQIHGIPTSNYIYFYENEWNNNKKSILEKINGMKYPLYVKPACLGSSIGITKVSKEGELNNAIKLALTFGKKVLVEEGVDHTKEVNISVLGNREKVEVSAIEEINVNDDFYTFKEKYVNNYSKRNDRTILNKKIISKELIDDIKKYAAATFNAIEASGVARVDFLIDEKNTKVYVNEINTIPGDLSCYIWMNNKKNPQELIDNIIEIGLYNYRQKRNKTTSFSENLLENYDILKGNKIKKNK